MKNKYFINIFLLLILIYPAKNIYSQDNSGFKDLKLKKVSFNKFKGSRNFEQPIFLKTSDNKIIKTGKYGHAYPMVFDWDKDGLNDLLVGEFGMGKNANLLIYKNIGSKTNPKYSPHPQYAKDTENNLLSIEGN